MQMLATEKSDRLEDEKELRLWRRIGRDVSSLRGRERCIICGGFAGAHKRTRMGLHCYAFSKMKIEVKKAIDYGQETGDLIFLENLLKIKFGDSKGPQYFETWRTGE